MKPPLGRELSTIPAESETHDDIPSSSQKLPAKSRSISNPTSPQNGAQSQRAADASRHQSERASIRAMEENQYKEFLINQNRDLTQSNKGLEFEKIENEKIIE